jgi:hypothetical protein
MSGMSGNGHIGKGRPAWGGALLPCATRPWRTALWVLRVAWITAKTPGYSPQHSRPAALGKSKAASSLPSRRLCARSLLIAGRRHGRALSGRRAIAWHAGPAAHENAATGSRYRPRHPPSLPRERRRVSRSRPAAALVPARSEPCRAERTHASAISRIASRRRHSVRLAAGFPPRRSPGRMRCARKGANPTL